MFLVSYNEVLIVINFLKIAFLQNFESSRPPRSAGESRGCLLDTYFEEHDFLKAYDGLNVFE